MKKICFAAALTIAGLAAPSSAALLLPGTSGVAFLPFAAATQGTQLAFNASPGTARTFSGVLRSAVYLNSLSTLDFYFQFMRTGDGSQVDDGEVERITAASFRGFDVEAFSFDGDIDGAGAFTSSDTSGLASYAERNGQGSVVRMVFAAQPLDGMMTGSTYIFRTNATRYDTTGTFGVINGSSFEGPSFEPTAVPEPGTWGLLFAGFAAMGLRLRRRQRGVTAVTA